MIISTSTRTQEPLAPPTACPLDMKAITQPMVETHESKVNLDIEWRLENLAKMDSMLRDNKEALEQALYKDIGRTPLESWLTECMGALQEIDHIRRSLRVWMKPKRVPSPILMAFSKSQTRRIPLRPPGVLVIGPCNYPLMLTVAHAAGAIAGGNPVVIKPSEMTPHTSALLQKLVSEYLDPSVLQVVQGGIPETTQLLEHEWGKICFTGSERVGKIVSIAAAKTLTPVVLELGGKSPVYVDKDVSNLRMVAERFVWGKLFNAGQTCICPDYFVLHKDIADEFMDLMIAAYKKQQWEDLDKSFLARMVSVAQAERQQAMLKEVEQGRDTKIIQGGSHLCKPDEKYVEPTFIVNPSRTSRLMTEEIFGPIAPIHIVESREEAKNFISSMRGIPLALYVCTDNDEVYEDFLQTCPSGSVCRNDAIFQFVNNRLPLAGLGTSGHGYMKGRYSFESFTHERGELQHSLVFDSGAIRPPIPEFLKPTMQKNDKMPYMPVINTKALAVTAVLFALWNILPTSGFKRGIMLGLATFLQGVVDILRNAAAA